MPRIDHRPRVHHVTTPTTTPVDTPASGPSSTTRTDTFGGVHGGTTDRPATARGDGPTDPRLRPSTLKGSLDAVARSIEAGEKPLAVAPAATLKDLAGKCATALDDDGGSRTAVRKRSSAATVLLDVAKASSARDRGPLLQRYAAAMEREKNAGLRSSMLVNLENSGMRLTGTVASTAESVRAAVSPTSPPYDAWLKGAHPKLEVRHIVMGEFFEDAVRGWKDRGFDVAMDGKNRAVCTRTLEDPEGKNPPVQVHVVMTRGETDIFRDLDDPKVQMVLYSGHSQLGGVVDGSLKTAPSHATGGKWVQLMQCRAKQTAGDVLRNFPDVHLTATFSSAYDPDDQALLDATFDTIARRGSYADLRASLGHHALIQPTSNYMLPDDARMLAARDSDGDALPDLSPLGPDRFFDPEKRAESGGPRTLRADATPPDPSTLSGVKVDHAVSYANTAFFYFAEESHASPIRSSDTDRMVPAGWFKGPSDQAVQFHDVKRDGKVFTEVRINAAYAGANREMLAGMVLVETQKRLCERDHGTFNADDRLRAMLMVTTYVDLFCEYSDDCDAVLKGVAERYGFGGVDYATLHRASLLDGDHGLGKEPTLAFLREHGVTTA